MNAELKAKWVAALRSGEYQQGRSRLRIGNGFCCLGVLADVVEGRSAWVQINSNLTDPIAHFCITTNMASSRYGSVEGLFSHDQEQDLIHMNDEACSQFTEIADYIEANL